MKFLSALTLISLLLGACSCSKESSSNIEKPQYDSVSGVYNIPETELSFRLPSPESSIVADPETLPDHMTMCIIDTVDNAGVFLFNLPDEPQTKYAAELAVRQIATQNNPDFNVGMVYDIVPDTFLNSAGWRFNVGMTLSKHADSLAVTYRGYLFNKSAFVITAESKTLTDSLFNRIIAGLTRNGESH